MLLHCQTKNNKVMLTSSYTRLEKYIWWIYVKLCIALAYFRFVNHMQKSECIPRHAIGVFSDILESSIVGRLLKVGKKWNWFTFSESCFRLYRRSEDRTASPLSAWKSTATVCSWQAFRREATWLNNCTWPTPSCSEASWNCKIDKPPNVTITKKT